MTILFQRIHYLKIIHFERFNDSDSTYKTIPAKSDDYSSSVESYLQAMELLMEMNVAQIYQKAGVVDLYTTEILVLSKV